MPMRFLSTAVAGMALALLVAIGTATAAGTDTTHLAFAPVKNETSIPVGHAQFCKRHRAECVPHARIVEAAELNEALWQQLLTINAHYNAVIAPMTDQDQYNVAELWTYPDTAGDCEDYALAKRRALMDAGWFASTLLMTVVRQPNGDGHAVLTVRTDRGDLVLDNQDGMIRLWSDTPYTFLKRQSQADAGRWVDIDDSRSVRVAAR